MATDQNIILGIKGQDQGALALFQAAQKELAEMGAEQKRLNTELKQYERIAQQANKTTRNSNGNYKEANRSSRMARGGVSQLGYQIQDVAVQLQGGQNLGLIIGQQGSQIASVFGSGGIVAGAIVSIGALIATTMVPRLFESGQEAKLLDEIFKELNDTLFSVGNNGVVTLSKEFENLAEVNRELADITLMRGMLKAQEAVRLSQEGIASSAKDLAVPALKALFNSQMQSGAAAQSLADDFGLTTTQMSELSRAAHAVRNDVDGSREALIELTNSLALDENVTATERFLDFAIAINEFAVSGEKAQEQIETITAISGDLDSALVNNTSSEVARKTAIDQSIASMQLQLNTYGRTATQIAIITAAINGATSSELQQIEAIQLKIQSMRDADAAEKAAIKSALERQALEQRNLDFAKSMILQTASAEDQYLIRYEENLQKLQEARALDVENYALYTEAIIALQQHKVENEAKAEEKARQEVEKAEEAKKRARQEGMNFIAQSASQLESAFEEGSKAQKAAFLVNQGIAAANAFVNTNEQASKHLGSPMYGVIMAMGMANVAAIVGQTLGSFDGGGFTGMGARTGGVDGKGGFPAILHPNETVIDHSKGQNMATNVTVNISAVDTKGFDELLYKRRGHLVSIINQAINNRGRASLA